ncbi:hypothetical protein AC249_AIPGENE18389 [Exaiptasia diaphana]|nr:hypothetical protein AC249_AIPGENE18389 [Exaiptasia diaphana]
MSKIYGMAIVPFWKSENEEHGWSSEWKQLLRQKHEAADLPAQTPMHHRCVMSKSLKGPISLERAAFHDYGNLKITHSRVETATLNSKKAGHVIFSAVCRERHAKPLF